MGAAIPTFGGFTMATLLVQELCHRGGLKPVPSEAEGTRPYRAQPDSEVPREKPTRCKPCGELFPSYEVNTGNDEPSSNCSQPA